MESEKHVDRHAQLPAERIAVYSKPHDDQYVHYSHEMPDETKEASGRFVLRVVPLLYGVLLGGLSGNLWTGIAIGSLASFGLDLTMGKDSLFKPTVERARVLACPYLAALVNTVSRRLVVKGLRVPSFLRDIRCAVS